MPSLPIVAVYFDDPNPMGYPFGEPEYLESYWTLSQNLLARGYAMVISRGPKSYMGNMQFTGGTVITSATTIEPFDQAYIATTIYRKGYKLPTAATDHDNDTDDDVTPLTERVGAVGGVVSARASDDSATQPSVPVVKLTFQYDVPL